MKPLPENWNFWKKLGFSLVATPFLSFFGLVAITVIGALDDAVTRWQRAGRWWLIFIVGFILILIYVFYIDSYRRNWLKEKAREKIVNTLILYWQGKCKEEGKPFLDELMIEYMRCELIERIKCWGWSDPTLWSRYYPNEKYSHNIVEMTDGAIAKVEEKVKRFEDTGKL